MRATPALLAGVVVIVAIGAVWLARSRADDRASRGARVGSAVCLSCHSSYDGFDSTAHHLTSRVAASRSIAGSFEPGENVLRTSNPYLHFRMDSTAEGFFQTAVIGEEPATRTRRERFDIVIGSARKGQTYLSWRDGSALVQLPVSYWEGAGWVNSPGYRDGLPNFGRPVLPRCLECHASYLEPLPDHPAGNAYDPETAELGIGCETCHGAGAVHVRRQGSWARAVLGQAIVNPAELPRTAQLEACALCHAGPGESRAEAFSFVPGDPLGEHLRLTRPTADRALDVHGNQVALLMASPCFDGSDMTCSTCHDVHRTQRQAAAYSARCLECHAVESCGLFPARGPALAENCVDCHMPRLPSNTVLSTVGGDTLQPRVRTHLIRVYGGADSLALRGVAPGVASGSAPSPGRR